MSKGRAIVVGGGVIGASCCYYLARNGWQVEIIDRGGFGKGCSHGNCGLITPSHVLPLAEPGAVRRALFSMLQKNSPFAVRPRLSPALWGWLWRFARHCNREDQIRHGRGIQALLQSSRRLYDRLMSEEPFDCEWETRGLLFPFLTPSGLEHFAETHRLLAEHFQLSAQMLDGAALVEFEPALKPGLAGGFLFRSDAHLRPDRLMSSWRRILEAQGVAITENLEVHGLDGEGGRALSVLATHAKKKADAFVIAAGAWTPFLNRELGCKLPIQPGKGYSITMSRPAICPRIPLLFEEHRVAVTPWESGYRLGSTMEFAGYDTRINPRRLALLTDGARHYLREPFCEPVLEKWYGWRPMTPDSLPIIDRSPRFSNVWIAAGHNMLGVSMAPATGQLVMELMNGQPPHIDPAPYAVR